MEIIDTALIERIRKALIKRYDRDQQIQQMIEEIGAEEGLNETELAIVYQAYLEVKERIYYTSSLVDLWNQIEEVQKRMSMLHTYDSLEEDLFGNVLGDDKEDIIISDGSYLGKGSDAFIRRITSFIDVIDRGKGMYECVPKGFSKASAMQLLSEHLNISMDNTWAFGDSSNDLPMFEAAAHGIAMGDHSSVLEPFSEMITDTVDNDGIAKALSHFGLI